MPPGALTRLGNSVAHVSECQYEHEWTGHREVKVKEKSSRRGEETGIRMNRECLKQGSKWGSVGFSGIQQGAKVFD